MITYNHEAFIKQAIEGVLKQNTNFDIEFIIADDCSTDQTESVINEILENQFKASSIRYIRHHKNLGMIPNFVFALKKCKGKYIALCEGDDYWIDPLKLQKQVDFLEGNEEYSGIGSNSEVIYEDNPRDKHLYSRSANETLKLNDLLEARRFHTATFLFRTKDFKSDFPVNILSGDRLLFMLIACFGKIKLIEDVTAIYRKNVGGISKNVTSKQLKKDFKIAKYISKYNTNFDIFKLQSFVAYTVFHYSTKIYLYDFITNSCQLFYYRLKSSNNKSRKAIIIDTTKFILKAMRKL